MSNELIERARAVLAEGVIMFIEVLLVIVAVLLCALLLSALLSEKQ